MMSRPRQENRSRDRPSQHRRNPADGQAKPNLRLMPNPRRTMEQHEQHQLYYQQYMQTQMQTPMQMQMPYQQQVPYHQQQMFNYAQNTAIAHLPQPQSQQQFHYDPEQQQQQMRRQQIQQQYSHFHQRGTSSLSFSSGGSGSSNGSHRSLSLSLPSPINETEPFVVGLQPAEAADGMRPGNAAILKALLADLCFWEVRPDNAADNRSIGITGSALLTQGQMETLAAQVETISPDYYYYQNRGLQHLSHMRADSTNSLTYSIDSRLAGSIGFGNMSTNSGGRSTSQVSFISATSSEFSSEPSPHTWRSAVDKKTGRTYYYDTVTRTSQWIKPPEVRAYEKRQRKLQRQRDKAFFREMEANLYRSLSRGELVPGIAPESMRKQGPPNEPVSRPGQRARTISGMSDVLLAELRDDRPDKSQTSSTNRRPSNSVGSLKPAIPRRPPLPASNSQRQMESQLSFDLSPDQPGDLNTIVPSSGKDKYSAQRDESMDLVGERLLDAECDVAAGTKAGGHIRRNTGNTIYVQSTMTNPNVAATIRCVCGVYRAHIVQASERKSAYSPNSVLGSPDAEIFNDDYETRRRGGRATPIVVPSISDVVQFYQEFYRRSQMEHDTIIMSLIYIERLVKNDENGITPSPENWRSVLFSCMVLASKVWDDLSMWNIDFSNVSANAVGLSTFSLRRINDLEILLLKSLNFDVRVPASEYAKYYFLVRTMSLRSGLLEDTDTPLRKETAFRTLEKKTSAYQDNKLQKLGRGRRTHSLDDHTFYNEWFGNDKEKDAGKSKNCKMKTGPVLRDAVCLEQLIG